MKTSLTDTHSYVQHVIHKIDTYLTNTPLEEKTPQSNLPHNRVLPYEH
jgi:hypothetical protein